MPTYEITSKKTGKVYEVDGPHPPTKAQVADIVARMDARAGGASTEPHMMAAPVPQEPHMGAAPAPEEPGFFQSMVDAAAPSELRKSLGYNVTHPGEAVDPRNIPSQLGQLASATAALPGQLMQAQGEPFKRAQESYEKGNYAGTLAHGLNYLLPILGPMLDPAVSMAERGNVRGALGHTVGLALPSVLPELLPKGIRLTPGIANPNPAEAAAAEWGQAQGIPVDAGTATGSKFVKGSQYLLDRSLAAEALDTPGIKATARALADTGSSLAERAAPKAGPQTIETAGTGLRTALEKKRGGFEKKADIAYDKFRSSEADPANQVPIEAQPLSPDDTLAAEVPEGASFRVPGALDDTHENLFERVLVDARKQGYEGTATQLRQALDAKYDEAGAIQREMRGEAKKYSPEELFQAIKDYGGIGADAGYPGEIKWLWENSSGVVVPKGLTKTGKLRRSRSLATGGMKGVTEVLRKTDGKTLDMMAESLRQDPRFQDIKGPNELLKAIGDGVSHAPGAEGFAGEVSLSDLENVGVAPGVKWWEGERPGGDISFDPAALEAQPPPAPVATRGPTVDMREVKKALRPAFDRWERTWTPTVKSVNPAYTTVKALLEGADDVPWSEAEDNLSTLKGNARTPSGKRNRSQGLAAHGVGLLQQAVDTSVGEAPGAVEALRAGRAASKASWDTHELITNLREEPVRVVHQVVQSRDASIKQLRTLYKQAPGAMPAIGRALLEDMITRATASGGFSGARGLLSEWRNIGPETKAILFGHDPGLVKDLDHFFLLSKTMEENINPSGTGLIKTVQEQGRGTWRGIQGGAIVMAPLTNIVGQLGAAGFSKLLHSRMGVRMLTEGLTVPVKGARTAAQTAALVQLSRLANKHEQDRQQAATQP